MQKLRFTINQIDLARQLRFLLVAVVPLSIVTGSLVALFLWLLDLVTAARWQQPWLLFLLPVAGVLIALVYHLYGRNAAGGNNIIIDEIHEPGGGVPARMAPLVLATTLITHLFGGSAGREGTAVQMGGSLAGLLARYVLPDAGKQSTLLFCGIAAGFGAVFGTPVAGAVFAVEVVAIGQLRNDALLPCFIASLLADIVCRMYGIHHTTYSITWMAEQHGRWLNTGFSWALIGKVIIAAMAFGVVAKVFAASMHGIKRFATKYIAQPLLLPVVGGILVIVVTMLLGTSDYLGLGVTNPHNGVSIVSAFKQGGATTWSWLWKLVLTVITLGFGFKGGEVTPLFFIGATLGNTIAIVSGAPVDLFAALGFIAVFAGATNTPLACTIMGVELFGGEHVFYYALACFVAYYFSGHTGIYTAQRRPAQRNRQ